jgi:hypothetical protein
MIVMQIFIVVRRLKSYNTCPAVKTCLCSVPRRNHTHAHDMLLFLCNGMKMASIGILPITDIFILF